MTGIFDSGVGGLLILQDLMKQIPYSPFIYLADTKHFPYGNKNALQIHSLVKNNVEYLVSKGADNIIIACNTASTVLADSQYSVPVVGVIEVALEQAKVLSRNGQVVVLATEATVKSNIYIQKNEELKTHLHIYQQACPLLAPYVEEGSGQAIPISCSLFWKST